MKWAINAVVEFMFDQSSAHGAFAKDALNAKEMNVQPRGKQCKMHDTLIPADNPNPSLSSIHQTYVFFTRSLTFTSRLQVPWLAERDAAHFGGAWPANHT